MRNVFVGPNGLRAGWRALIFLALVVGMAVLAGRLIGPYLTAQTALGAATGPRFTIIAELATFCLPVIVATWIMGRIEKRSGWSYGLIDGQGIGHFVWGAFWGFISLSGLVGVLVLTGHLAFDSVALTGGMAIRFALEWAVAFLLVGVAEEMALRGYLQQVLTRGIGFWPAAVALSVGFGALHLGNTGEAIIGVATAGLAGLVFCYSLWRSGSLWWAIGNHMSWDWAQSYFYGVPDSGSMVSRHLLVSHASGASWLSGGSVGPEGSIFALAALLADVVIIRLTLRPRPDSYPGRLPGDGEGRDERTGGQVDGVDGARVGADGLA
jgi:membrane protease YdiL (CAAX protease family)